MADADAPAVGSLWYYPAWSNGNWSGPWKVVRVGEAGRGAEFIGDAVGLERVDGPPESVYEGNPNEYPLADWPCGWEPWPEVPDFPPQSAES